MQLNTMSCIFLPKFKIKYSKSYLKEPLKKDQNLVFKTDYHLMQLGVQWLSGRVLDSRPRGRRFEPHRRHCVVVLEQDTSILA